MKLVLNKCYGGFSLSHAAIMRYCSHAGITVYAHPTEWGGHIYTTGISEDSESFNEYDIERTDPSLVMTVEELGTAAASGPCAALEVLDMHSGQLYRIMNYDGSEWLEFPSDIHWSVAT